MKNTIQCMMTLWVMMAVTVSSAHAASYDLTKSTPVGSWQLRQEISRDAKGKEQLMEVRTSMVGEEKREGVDHVWVEMEMNTFRYNKGKKGKASGDPILLKILMEKSTLKGNPEDIINNLRAMGKEIIMQQGDADPIKIEEGGMIGNAMMKSLGMEIDYNFDETGSERVETPAGKFKSRVVEGSGSVEMSVIFKTIRVDSTAKQWLSDDVPFAIVKAESTSTMDGKTTTTSSLLLDHGKKGAVSKIKGEAQSMKIPGLGDLFGG